MDANAIYERLRNARHGIKYRFNLPLINRLSLDVMLWDSMADLRKVTGMPEERPALSLFVNDPKVSIGSLHFVSQNWNVNVIAHEFFHVMMHLMRMQKAFQSVFDNNMSTEENFALIMGKSVNEIFIVLTTYDLMGEEPPTPDIPTVN